MVEAGDAICEAISNWYRVRHQFSDYLLLTLLPNVPLCYPAVVPILPDFAQEELGRQAEHPNQRQQNAGLRADGAPCSSAVRAEC